MRDSEGMCLSLISLEGQGSWGVPVCNWLRAASGVADCPVLAACQHSGETCSLSQKKPPDRSCRCLQQEALGMDGDQRYAEEIWAGLTVADTAPESGGLFQMQTSLLRNVFQAWS